MSKVNPIAAARTEAPVTPPSPTKAAKGAVAPKLKKAAQEFEAMFVRQILTAAKVGGHDKQNGYDGMAVDAVAGAITKGGGLGLAREIEEAIRQAADTRAKKVP